MLSRKTKLHLAKVALEAKDTEQCLGYTVLSGWTNLWASCLYKYTSGDELSVEALPFDHDPLGLIYLYHRRHVSCFLFVHASDEKDLVLKLIITEETGQEGLD